MLSISHYNCVDMVASFVIRAPGAQGRRLLRAALVVILAAGQAAPAFAAQCCLVEPADSGHETAAAPAAAEPADAPSCHDSEEATTRRTAVAADHGPATAPNHGGDACDAVITGCCCTFEQGQRGQHPVVPLAAGTPVAVDGNLLPLPVNEAQFTLPPEPTRNATHDLIVTVQPVPLYLATATFRI